MFVLSKILYIRHTLVKPFSISHISFPTRILSRNASASCSLHNNALYSCVRAMSSENTHEAIIAKLSPEGLKDIEGFDGEKFGFGRAECCGPPPEKLPGSFKNLQEHVFVSSDLPAVQWDKRTENVVGLPQLEKALKADFRQTTAFHRNAPDYCVLQFKWEETLSSMAIIQYTGIEHGVVPWEAPGAVISDRSEEKFIFVCAHGARDGRCGYCGGVLVDLLRQAVDKKFGKNSNVHVYPCAHIGGHIYAGNVLVYTKQGGVCYGCFNPSDVDSFIEWLSKDDIQAPPQLAARVRGTMGAKVEEKESA